MRTRDVFIEICPECNTLHVVNLKNKKFPRGDETTLTCKMPVDFEEATEEGKDPVPIECGHEIQLSEEHNIYTVKRWTFKERSTFYEKAGVFEGKAPTIAQLKLSINEEDLNWVLRTATIKAPIDLTEENIGEMDGAIAESLFGAIMTFNMPPLGRSSVSR